MSEFQDSYRVELEIFEGPLDLLLYLIRKNELDIYDIPINLIVQQYTQYLDMMKALNLEVAGEFLVMAATLSHIKSRLLLPKPEEQAEEEDPRKELVQRLLEYQRYKEAALALVSRDQAGKEVFVRGFDEEGVKKLASEVKVERLDIEEVDLFQLIDAFQELIKRRELQDIKKVVVERIRVVDKISQILEKLREREVIGFEELFEGIFTRTELIVSFLALLELIRLQVVRAFQPGNFARIQIKRAVQVGDEKFSSEFLLSLVQKDKEGSGGEE